MPVAWKRVTWLLGSTILLTVGALIVVIPDGAAQVVQDVAVDDLFFDPAEVEIQVGDTVLWTNVGSESHDVTAVDGEFDSHPNCDLGSGTCLQPGETFEWTSTQPGEYAYYCEIHGNANGTGMTGTVIVAETAGTDTGTLAGTVTDAASGDPIEGATVTADGGSATTDAGGEYLIEDLTAGEYTVTAQADGYQWTTSQTATVAVGETTTVDFALDTVTPVPVGPTVGLALVADGLTAPVQLLSPPGDSGRLFIVDQAGLIRVVSPEGTLLAEPFLDLRDRMVALDPGFDERGALGMAFHPDYATNGRFFVYYSAPLRPEGPEGWDHTSHISEFAVSEDPVVADPDSERIVLQVDQPQPNHNGGQVMFGPGDGHLYISLGDGGAGNDIGTGHTPSLGNAQDITNLLGSILRIDVDGAEPYAIPDDNPFVGTEGRDEIFAYGLRNPYRFTFDQTGDLLAGDAGQALWEEVSLIVNGGNYGWNIKEGTHCFDPTAPTEISEDCPDIGPRGEPLIDPVIEYPNIRQPGGIGRVIVGGHVYRGSDVPQLEGRYVFGDWGSSPTEPDGTLLVGEPDAAGLWPLQEIAVEDNPDGRLGHYVLGFGRDAAGEIYVLSSDSVSPSGDTGKVYRLTDGTDPGQIAGTVTDADSGDPIAGATVTADGGSATTDTDGDYTIDDLDAGDYTVTAEADGYEAASQTASVEETETSTVNFALAPDAGEPEQACPPGDVVAAEFNDRDDIPEAHLDAVDCASFHDIVRGFADGSFGPTRPVRRDQMAAFIVRTLGAAGVTLPAPATDQFTDVAAGSTHDEDIHRLAAAEIVLGGPGGLPATSFGPDLRVRRDQMASFLIRAVEFATGEELASDSQAFDDVLAGNAHFGTVNAAAELALAEGFGDGTYRPGADVRRDQMATFVVRLLTHLVEE